MNRLAYFEATSNVEGAIARGKRSRVRGGPRR